MAPTDEELLELMPQGFRDDLALVSRMAAHGAGPEVQPGLFRVSLNTGALGYARAVWDRARAALAEPDGPTLQLPEQAPDEHPPSNLDRREVAAWYHGHGCGWQAARAVLARWGHQPAPPAEREHEVASPTQDELWELWLRLDRELPDRPAAVAAFWEHAQVEARARWGRPAPAPAGEVAELVEWLRDHAYVLNPSAERKARRICDLLEQRHPTPVPVSKRVPGPEDCHFNPGAEVGSCWCFNPVEHLGGIAWWSFEPLEWSESATHWLPATALPLPSGEVE